MRPLITLIILFLYCCSYGQLAERGTKLVLSGRQLKKIPDSVFSKTQLTYLDLGWSKVVIYPPLSGGRDYDSFSNHISQLPGKISKLTNLQTLILSANNLTTLPKSISKLTKLEVLDLSSNTDFDILKEAYKIGQLPNLKVLKLVDVKFNRTNIDTLKRMLRPETKIILTLPEYFKS